MKLGQKRIPVGNYIPYGKKYYSVREKINYYNKVIAGKVDASAETKRKAKLRLKTLNKLNTQNYYEPKFIVTDDNHFGNKSKPRLCVAISEGTKNRILVAPVNKRKTSEIILDKNIGRSISKGHTKMIDRNDVYKSNYIYGKHSLTRYDKEKIKDVFK